METTLKKKKVYAGSLILKILVVYSEPEPGTVLPALYIG